MIMVYGIRITKDEKVASLLEECGFDVIYTKHISVAGIITKEEELASVDEQLWDEHHKLFQDKYEEILEGEGYFRIYEEDIIC